MKTKTSSKGLLYLFFSILFVLFFNLQINAQKSDTSAGIPISGKWSGWSSMTMQYSKGIVRGTYSDTYSDSYGYVTIYNNDTAWNGVWEEKSIKRKGRLYNISISNDGKSIKGLYDVVLQGKLSNGSQLPNKTNVPFHWKLTQALQNPNPVGAFEEEGEEEYPHPQVCKEEHKVNMKSTMWIADMNLENEMVAYQAFLDRNNVPLDEHPERHGKFNLFVAGTNLFPDDGSHAEPADPKERLFRIASEFNFDVVVIDGELVHAQAVNQPFTRGGYENLGLFGSSHGRVLNELMLANRYTCRYIIYGDPHFLANLSLNRLELRTSTRIWHYIEIEITPNADCSINTRARFRASSAYPSHRLWINDEEVDYGRRSPDAYQGSVIQLWEATKIDIEKNGRNTDLPPNDFAGLLRFMGSNINQWVRPRFNPTTLLDWP